MKEQLTNEEIARIFALYYNCRVFFVKNPDMEQFVSDAFQIGMAEKCYDPLECKLLLNPLSEISDEDAIIVARMMCGSANGEFDKSEKIVKRKEDRVEVRVNLVRFAIYYDGLFVAECQGLYLPIPEAYMYTQLLISKGYAVPLFFAPNHWANGKTAIELGIAIPHSSHNQQ